MHAYIRVCALEKYLKSYLKKLIILLSLDDPELNKDSKSFQQCDFFILSTFI